MKKTLQLFIALVLIICLFAAPAAAAPSLTDFSEIDAYIEQYLSRNNIPGVSLVITKGSAPLYSKGYGIAGPDRPMTADTAMFIGSQSKSFTALAVMQLVEAGLVDLDAPLQRYIPWFQVADRESSARITVRSLLNHTSGLSEAGYVPNLPDGTSIEQAVRDLQRARPTARVGEKFQYFNPGYIILGHLVEAVSGQTYAEYLRQHIFEPLGMQDSSASFDEIAGMELAQGYSQAFGFPLPMKQRIPQYYLPAGFIVSTANDMGRYLMAMENGGELVPQHSRGIHGRRILSESGVQAMFTPNRAIGSRAGFGWDIESYYGEPQITHGGATERFYTSVVILPQSDLTVVMLFNQDHMFKATYDYLPLFWGVVNLLSGHPVVEQGISSVVIGWGLLVAFIFVLGLSLRGLLSLRQERHIQENLPIRKRWLRLLPHLAWITGTLILVTLVGPSLAGRSFDLRWFVGFYPDLVLLAGVVLIAEGVQLIYQAAVALGHKGSKILPG